MPKDERETFTVRLSPEFAQTVRERITKRRTKFQHLIEAYLKDWVEQMKQLEEREEKERAAKEKVKKGGPVGA